MYVFVEAAQIGLIAIVEIRFERGLLNDHDIPRLILKKGSQCPLLVFQLKQTASHIIYIRKGRICCTHIVPIFQRGASIDGSVDLEFPIRDTCIHQ